MNNTVNLYSLSYSNVKTYWFAVLFVIGNIVLPQICHLVPDGGFIFLPIYFFTLIGAYKYGWKVGLLTALASPLVNHILFGMPPLAVLPSIIIKSVILAFAASFIANKFRTVTLLHLLTVVLLYQIAGSFIESGIVGSLVKGFQDFRIGIPGMLLQIFGGYAFIKYALKK
ncbi:MAG: ECF transporter S component [Muribaculaceae bacterium]|nr:ECF transporter S component [Muribaculaceae bacterium]